MSSTTATLSRVNLEDVEITFNGTVAMAPWSNTTEPTIEYRPWDPSAATVMSHFAMTGAENQQNRTMYLGSK